MRALQEDPELRRLLLSLPQPKYIFTNGDIKHARTVLSIVGIADIFQVQILRFLCTPSIDDTAAAAQDGLSIVRF